MSAPLTDTSTTPASAAIDAFRALRTEVLEDCYRRQPTLSTYLGMHQHDASLEDYSAEAVADEIAAARGFQSRLEAIAPAELPADDRVDRQQLILSLESAVLRADVIRPWTTSPDLYSSGLTNSAYALVKREFAPAEERLAALVTRLRAMPAALDHARRNLDVPPRVYTELAIEQLDGNRAFFEAAVPQAFASVDRPSLQAEFRRANRAVIEALTAYKTWLRDTLLPRSRGPFACGAEAYRRRLWADEMVDTSLDELLAMAEADLAQNRRAFEETARRIDPSRSTAEVLAEIERHRPRADELISTTQAELDALAAFLADHDIVTLPADSPVQVKETPPFLRATTSASIEVPGPFEQVATEAYYNMTLPDPAWPEAEREDFMRQWYYAAITNVSVHEVWPGHHLQFLHVRTLSSDVRRVLGVASNVEGWAHYAEQMVLDEGFHAEDPRYRIAQLQDALLRDVRFVVGIRMHTQGMSVAEAEQFFRTEAHQTPHVARVEARRGTFDATYGYYTLGKLMVLKLRDEYKAAIGPAYTLRGFHDAFLQAGPLPLPLVRETIMRGLARP
jgi:uncharacterized protein (DUF885 family)